MADQPALAAFAAAAQDMGCAVAPTEPLARHTTFRIGGPADLLTAAHSTEMLAQLAGLVAAHQLPLTVLGGGSNVLVSDAGVRGVVILNEAREFALAEETGRLVAASGVTLAGLARWAARRGWAGLEWAVSVPGTVGGAVIGNAGAHGGCVADNLAWAEVVYADGKRQTLTVSDLDYTYRRSILRDWIAGRSAGPVALRAAFDLTRGNPAEIGARADAYLARRRATQPTEPSAGSIFRNPPGDYAGRLIEAVGLRGHSIGGAQISPRHANFIINTGAASAADVAALIHLARLRVHEQFGVRLTPEILPLGEWIEGQLWTNSESA
jgi:UDP-N-acetylmuramate dehydrogenase